MTADHGLTHVDETGAARMVDVSGKAVSVRSAVATGRVLVSDDVVRGQPRLVVGDVAYPLVRGITRLGRGTDADIRVVDPGASRNHCEIVIGTPVLLRDTGSTNGTFVDGKRVTEITIDDGTEILIGSTSLTFKNS